MGGSVQHLCFYLFQGQDFVGSTILMDNLGSVARAVILVGLLIVGGCSDSFAQGSTGGTIGKEDKSVSGTRSSEPEARPERRSKPKSEARRAPARGGGGGGSASRFDGKWTFVATGCGAGTKHGDISGGKISSWGGGGQVSASGVMRASFTAFGKSNVVAGHLYGVTGTGTYTRNDGCTGPWTAIKQ